MLRVEAVLPADALVDQILLALVLVPHLLLRLPRVFILAVLVDGRAQATLRPTQRPVHPFGACKQRHWAAGAAMAAAIAVAVAFAATAAAMRNASAVLKRSHLCPAGGCRLNGEMAANRVFGRGIPRLDLGGNVNGPQRP